MWPGATGISILIARTSTLIHPKSPSEPKLFDVAPSSNSP